MDVTESMNPATHGQPVAPPVQQQKPWWRRKIKAEAISAAAAVITLAGVVLGGRWLSGDNKAAPNPTPPPPAPTSAAPTTAAPAPAPATGTPTPTATGGTYLDSLSPVGGSPVPLPAVLDPADFPHSVTVGCPDNQGGNTATIVKYELNRRFRTLRATVSGWSEEKTPSRVQVQVFTITALADETTRRDSRGAQTVTVNAGRAELVTPVVAGGDAGRAGVGADEIELVIGCEQPHDAVILSDARVS